MIKISGLYDTGNPYYNSYFLYFRSQASKYTLEYHSYFPCHLTMIFEFIDHFIRLPTISRDYTAQYGERCAMWKKVFYLVVLQVHKYIQYVKYNVFLADHHNTDSIYKMCQIKYIFYECRDYLRREKDIFLF